MAKEKPVARKIGPQVFYFSSILDTYLFTWKRFQPSLR